MFFFLGQVKMEFTLKTKIGDYGGGYRQESILGVSKYNTPGILTVKNPGINRVKSTFPPSSTLSWNQLDPNIQNSSSIDIFKRALLQFIRPNLALIYKIQYPRT